MTAAEIEDRESRWWSFVCDDLREACLDDAEWLAEWMETEEADDEGR